MRSASLTYLVHYCYYCHALYYATVWKSENTSISAADEQQLPKSQAHTRTYSQKVNSVYVSEL